MTTETFAYELDPRFAVVWAPLLIGPGFQGVTLTDDGRFVARFGLLRVETPLANIDGAHVTGPYRWWTAIGPRLSLKDDGMTFGTTSRGGVCVHFREPVRRVIGSRNHSALTVTVAERARLADALTS